MNNKVHIEHIIYLKEEVDKINKLDLSKIEFYLEGEPIEIPETTVLEFKFTGLNNMDFITCEFYEEE